MKPVLLPLLILTLCTSCIHVLRLPLYEDLPLQDLPAGEREQAKTRQQVESPFLRGVLFPVNLAPAFVSNMVVNLPPGNLWPIQYLVLPFASVYYGVRDSWHGYPFWEPTARWN